MNVLYTYTEGQDKSL